jgi:hypothetical protein
LAFPPTRTTCQYVGIKSVSYIGFGIHDAIYLKLKAMDLRLVADARRMACRMLFVDSTLIRAKKCVHDALFQQHASGISAYPIIAARESNRMHLPTSGRFHKMVEPKQKFSAL